MAEKGRRAILLIFVLSAIGFGNRILSYILRLFVRKKKGRPRYKCVITTMRSMRFTYEIESRLMRAGEISPTTLSLNRPTLRILHGADPAFRLQSPGQIP